MTGVIRLATTADGPSLAAIYAPAVTERATSFELDAPDGAEMARRVAALVARTPWLVCERDGAVVGYAYASPHRDRPAYQWSVEVSAYVHAGAHRSGVGRALYESLFALLVLQGFRNAYAGVTLPNPASVGLHTSVGFTQVGVYRGVGYKAGAWHDVAWFERPLAERVTDPPPPRPLATLREEPALLAALDTGLPYLRGRATTPAAAAR
ncbi:MAG: arsinothricin resistance N-acetyltransferase ArsN1 family B [Gemmatimonadaceae bacterium]